MKFDSNKWYCNNHCTENHIFFFQMFWKNDLSKTVELECDLFCIIRKDNNSFPQKYDITFRRKIKDDLSKKNYMEIWYILHMFWKDSLSKKVSLEYDLSYVIRKDGISFSRKYDNFLTDGKWKMIFLK